MMAGPNYFAISLQTCDQPANFTPATSVALIRGLNSKFHGDSLGQFHFEAPDTPGIIEVDHVLIRCPDGSQADGP